jgi:Cys-rich repeat protein
MRLSLVCLMVLACGSPAVPQPVAPPTGSSLGAPCTSDSDCGTGTFCNAGYTWGATKCVPLIDHGSCLSDQHCLSGRCAGVCIDANRCQAAPSQSTLGWSCLDDTDCCDPGSRCTVHYCGVAH